MTPREELLEAVLADAIAMCEVLADSCMDRVHDTAVHINRFRAALSKDAIVKQLRPLAWNEAALCLGERMSDSGPSGYYDFTPKQWLDWASVAFTASASNPNHDALVARVAELSKALSDVLPFAESKVRELNAQMVGNLYPAINSATIERARAALARGRE